MQVESVLKRDITKNLYFSIVLGKAAIVVCLNTYQCAFENFCGLDTSPFPRLISLRQPRARENHDYQLLRPYFY